MDFIFDVYSLSSFFAWEIHFLLNDLDRFHYFPTTIFFYIILKNRFIKFCLLLIRNCFQYYIHFFKYFRRKKGCFLLYVSQFLKSIFLNCTSSFCLFLQLLRKIQRYCFTSHIHNYIANLSPSQKKFFFLERKF